MKLTIKHLAEDDRPREKFLLKGKNSLSDAELLAIIMGSGSRQDSAVDLARKILKSVGDNWHQLSKLSISDLQKFNGVGEAKAISILTALEIGRRRAAQEVPELKKISSSLDAFHFFRPYLGDLQTEEFWAIYVNQSNKVVHYRRLSTGGITFSLVDVRILFKIALEYYATGIFIAHNHPSGGLRPSNEDRRITTTVAEAGKLLNIFLIDHLIVSQDAYFSFADEGLL